MDFYESETYQNLIRAFDEEAKASTRLRLFAEKARKDGYMQIGHYFDVCGWNEQQHAKIWQDILNGGAQSSTLENLKKAAAEVSHECDTLYQQFAATAMEEGYEKIADEFLEVAGIEQLHEQGFEHLENDIVEGTMFCKHEQVLWLCMNCGYVYYGDCAPQICPVCRCPKSFYEMDC